MGERMLNAIKAAFAEYKRLRHEEKMKRVLLSQRVDHLLIQKFINALGQDKFRIGVDIVLPNGTIIKLRKEPPKEQRALRDPFVERIE